MLFHMSAAAKDPRNVSMVIAEIWGGEAMPFPPVTDAAWIAFAGDDRGTAMEVYPHDTVLRESEGTADAYGDRSAAGGHTPTHAAIATELSREAILELARREGWPAKYCLRGGMFGVIEMWVEGHQMIEVLTPEMQAQYVETVTIDNWRKMLAAHAPA